MSVACSRRRPCRLVLLCEAYLTSASVSVPNSVDFITRLFSDLLRCLRSSYRPVRLTQTPCRVEKYTSLKVQVFGNGHTGAHYKSRHPQPPISSWAVSITIKRPNNVRVLQVQLKPAIANMLCLQKGNLSSATLPKAFDLSGWMDTEGYLNKWDNGY